VEREGFWVVEGKEGGGLFGEKGHKRKGKGRRDAWKEPERSERRKTVWREGSRWRAKKGGN
jgi:hypothetical protein